MEKERQKKMDESQNRVKEERRKKGEETNVLAPRTGGGIEVRPREVSGEFPRGFGCNEGRDKGVCSWV